MSAERAAAEPSTRRVATEALIYLVAFLLFGGALAYVQSERKPERAGIRVLNAQPR